MELNTTFIPAQIAKHLREVHFGGNWTCVHLKEHVTDITWQQATTQVFGLNTIATLVFHHNYYLRAQIRVLQGQPLNAKDEESFNLPPIGSEADWQQLLTKTWNHAETLASLIEQLPDSRLAEVFVETKYKTYYRNLHGLIEHAHYHLGQIVLIKKLLSVADNRSV